MNGADIAVLLGLAYFAARGYRGGLLREAMSVAAGVAGLWAALRWTEDLVPRVAQDWDKEVGEIPVCEF